MRILPRSLFGRLTLVLLVGLVLAQLLSASILLRDRGQTLYRSVRADLVERTAGIVRLLDALAPVERRRLLPLLSTPETRIRLTRAPVDARPTTVEQDSVTGAVERALRERLSAHNEVRVALWGTAPAEHLRPDIPTMHRRHMMGHDGPGPWAYLHGVALSAGGFLVQARLDDGSWVQFERRIPDRLFDRPTRLLLTLAVLLVSVVVLALLAVRWVVRPLHALRQAAEELGRDIRRAPLPETGPLEVRETARAFNTMQRRIRSFVEDRARILAAISHDLKTPLTRLRLRSDLLEDEDLRHRIHADLDDMETMVGATLDFMRSSEGREESRQLDLTALLESIRDDACDAGWAPLALRLPIGIIFAAHGAQKLFGWFGGHGLEGTGQWMASIGLVPGYLMAPLAAEGVLVVGSGSLTRNLHEFRAHGPEQAYVAAFADWIRQAITDRDQDRLVRALDIAPHARRAHPTPEHFWPLLIAVGAATDWLPATVLDGGIEHGILAMDAYLFGQKVDANGESGRATP
jgi:signal transduction histidine kinase